SSVLSARGARTQPPVPQELPAAVVGPNGEPMVNIANIQNWIASVVNETLVQKQAEMMMGASLAPSRAGSVFSLGAGRGADDDRASTLSGSTRAEAQSVLPCFLSEERPTSPRSKITTTSVPLYSLFQDQVNLHKLDTMEKEIKSDMRDKMASYEVKKIAEDNKRSTLYKKKKPKEEEEEDDEAGHGKSNGFDNLLARSSEKPKPKRDYGRSGILNLPASASNPTSSIDEWLQNVRPPQSKPKPYDGDGEPPRMSRPSYEAIEEPSEFDFPSRRSSIAVNDDEEEEYRFASRFSSRQRADDDMDLGRDPSPEFNYRSRSGSGEDAGYGTRRSYASYEEEERSSYQNYSAKQKSSHASLYENTETARTAKAAQGDEEDEEISAFIAQIKQRARARVAEEMEDDEVLSAWRKQ
ncbi:hypothetical protein M9458_002478, partial [Cirrhinus mrigala]